MLRDTPDPTRRPRHSYVPGGRVLHVPRHLLDATIAVFAECAVRKVEACCYWYGVEGSAQDRVHAVAVPRQENGWGWYDVTAEAMAEVSAATRSRKWVNLSQIHTHPSSWVEHSPYDDVKANSRRALSIVFPHYGAWSARWPDGVGVHEYQEGWHTLAPADAATRVVIVEAADAPTVVDLRD